VKPARAIGYPRVCQADDAIRTFGPLACWVAIDVVASCEKGGESVHQTRFEYRCASTMPTFSACSLPSPSSMRLHPEAVLAHVMSLFSHRACSLHRSDSTTYLEQLKRA
jgi:hypothetical protein